MSIQTNINLLSIDTDDTITEYDVQVLLMQGNKIQEFLIFNNVIHNIYFQTPFYYEKPIIHI